MVTATQPRHFVLALGEIDRTHLATVGGKGANLGELSRIDGFQVPAGFCVTTEAFDLIISASPNVKERLDQLACVALHDRDAIQAVTSDIRTAVEAAAIPEVMASEITQAVQQLGGEVAYAVRSSATAEDSPTASFAGQHDSYLNVIGTSTVLDYVRRCWASLFTERAVIYRLQNDIDHRSVTIAVVVQQMVNASVSGLMFTADPLSFDRTVVAIEACAGLGEALVSGWVNPDVFRVRDEKVVDATRHDQATLSDEEVVRLAALGRHIETHFGQPQDIEWCFADNEFSIVQSRPITTLFPVPQANDEANHVYVSVGHNQMMTDAMTPFGLSFWQMTTPMPMAEAGGRLFVDVTTRLAVPRSQAALLEVFGKGDPLLRTALQTVIDRGDFIPSLPDSEGPAGPVHGGGSDMIDADPALITGLIAESQASIAACKRDIETKSESALFEFILADMQALRQLLFNPQSTPVFMTAMNATHWINENVLDWLGEKNVADTLTQSIPNNITSEMGLALLDVADVIRPHADIVSFLSNVEDDEFLSLLATFGGGPEVRTAIDNFLNMYGMRGVGEIDISRPRWSERPSSLLPLILAHVKNGKPGEAKRRFEQGRKQAQALECSVLERLLTLPDGEAKAAETKQMIDRIRTFMGYREYPKYGMVCRYFLYKRALLAEAERLVANGVFRENNDMFYLRFEELHDVVRTGLVDSELIEGRKVDFQLHQRLVPPRVLTSDGEALNGTHQRNDLPINALAGIAVSAGTIEGRARIVRDIADANLEPGDILVTAYTDPSWTPLFVGIAGLVTEVGGTMTHGAVIAREYGLPAVVGVERATERIEDGQQIRVHGTDGYVELLPLAE